MNSESCHKPTEPFPLAIVQMPITGDAHQNGMLIQHLMRDAAAQGARMIQFPEGALSGYAKNPIKNWDEVNWESVRAELEAVIELARECRIWVVIGSAHPLDPPDWPHNSLYIISDEGKLVTRYDKRLCSYTEAAKFYTPGSEAITFEVDGYIFGCLICVEINFPSLLIEYEKLGVHCLLLSSYPVDKIFHIKARAYAGIHNYWVGLSVPTECANLMRAGLIGPDGNCIAEVKEDQGIVVANIDLHKPQYDISLNRARPWRSSAIDDFNHRQPVINSRSVDRSCF